MTTMETILFDVMVNGYFVKTYKYEHHKGFPLDIEALRLFVIDRLPSLKNKEFEIALY